MKRLLSCLTLVVLIAGTLPRVSTAADESEKNLIVPVFTLNGPFMEKPIGDDMLFGGSGAESFQQLITRLKKVKGDDKVKAIVLLSGATSLGNGQIEEVRQVMDEIKESGKAIYAHADSLSMRTYVLLSGASRLSVVPNGDLWLTGMYGESVHLRGLFDMVGVTPDFLTCGAYKSAAETYTRTQPSKEADANVNWIMDGIYDAYKHHIADGRGKDVETVEKWINTGLFSPAAAREAGIIDQVEFRQDMVQELKSKFGDGIKFDRKYAKKKGKEIDLSTFGGVIKFYTELLAGPTSRKSGKDAIAIVYVDGPILPGASNPNSFPFGMAGVAYSTPIRKALDKVANDETVKGVVLRVNSPGGSAVASEIILQATRRVKDEKPFAVSMGDVAGSGGYYVACAADSIFADPSTITASIGVVAGKLATGQMWNKIGVTWKEYRRGENSGLLASSQPFTDDENQTLQTWMDEIYEVFKGHVLSSRKDRLTKDLEEIAGGRVYTGKQALDLGLVDKLGGLEAAIAHVAGKAGIDDYEVRIEPRPKNFAELLTESLRGGSSGDDPSSISTRVAAALSPSHRFAEMVLPYLKELEPSRLRSVKMALDQLTVLENEQVMLTMPILEIRDR